MTVLLLWAERWHEATRTENRGGDVARQLHRRFARLLESDFARHHDGAHYADALLGVPPAARSRALTAATGRSTKHLVTDRVMAESARLMRFTDLTVGEVAHAVGYRDPLYISRAFARPPRDRPPGLPRRRARRLTASGDGAQPGPGKPTIETPGAGAYVVGAVTAP